MSETPTTDPVGTDEFATRVIARKTTEFTFELPDGDETYEWTLKLSQHTQADHADLDHAAQQYYLQEQRREQREFLEDFRDELSDEQIQKRLDEFRQERQQAKITGAPSMKVKSPKIKDGKVVKNDLDLPVVVDVEIPYTAYYTGKTREGWTMIIYLAARHNHPELTHEEVHAKLSNSDQLEEALQQFYEINKSLLGESSTDGSEKAETKRERRRKRNRDRRAK